MTFIAGTVKQISCSMTWNTLPKKGVAASSLNCRVKTGGNQSNLKFNHFKHHFPWAWTPFSRGIFSGFPIFVCLEKWAFNGLVLGLFFLKVSYQNQYQSLPEYVHAHLPQCTGMHHQNRDDRAPLNEQVFAAVQEQERSRLQTPRYKHQWGKR